MLCLACGRDHVNLTTEVGLRPLECLDCSDIGRQQPRVGPAQIGVTQELSAAALPSDGSFSSAVDGRAAEPNTWVQSLKRAQQRCEALAEAAARHRAARGAHRKGTVADRRAFMLPPKY